MTEGTSKKARTIAENPGLDSPIRYFSSRHWKRAYTHARSLARNPADAEDIAQESYVRLFESFIAGRRIESSVAWLKGVISKLVVDQFRKTRPDLHTSVDSIFDEFEDGRQNIVDRLADDSISTEEQLVQKSLLQESLRVLAGLPDRDRECVLMYARGYKFVQIASALGIPYEAAIATTRRALEKTRRRVAGVGPWKLKSQRSKPKPIGGDQEFHSSAIEERAATTDEGQEPQCLMKDCSEDGDLLSFGDVVLNVGAHEILRREQPIKLSCKEVELLRYLLRHRDETLTRDRLLKEVWGYVHSSDMRTLDTHIARLRKKLEPEPRKPRFILTVRGVGYKFIDGENPLQTIHLDTVIR